MSPVRAASGRPVRRIVLDAVPEPVVRRRPRLRRLIDWFLRLPEPRGSDR